MTVLMGLSLYSFSQPIHKKESFINKPIKLFLIISILITLTGCTGTGLLATGLIAVGANDYITRATDRGYFFYSVSDKERLINWTCDLRWNKFDQETKKFVVINPNFSYSLCTEEFENEPQKMKLLKYCAEEVKKVQPDTETIEYNMLINQCLDDNHINLKADGGYIPK